MASGPINLDVRADLTEARKFLNHLGPGVDRAAARALNDTITTVRAQGARAIKEKHKALRIGDIKKNMKLGRATRRLLSASTSTEGKPLSLKLFKPATTRAGVKATIGNTRTLMGVPGRRVFQITKFENEYFHRRSGTRGIRKFRGPSLPGVFRARLDDFKDIAIKRWRKAFPNRLQYEIEKAKASARRG